MFPIIILPCYLTPEMGERKKTESECCTGSLPRFIVNMFVEEQAPSLTIGHQGLGSELLLVVGAAFFRSTILPD